MNPTPVLRFPGDPVFKIVTFSTDTILLLIKNDNDDDDDCSMTYKYSKFALYLPYEAVSYDRNDAYNFEFLLKFSRFPS